MQAMARAAAVAAVMVLTACGGGAQARHSAGTASERSEPSVVGAEVVETQPKLPEESADEFADIATDPEQFAAAWRRFRLRGEPPAVDFDESIVLFVGFGESGSCPERFEGVTVQGDVVNVEFSTEFEACTADYNPRTFVVSLPRDQAPEGEFVLELNGGRSFTLTADRADAPPSGPSVVHSMSGEEATLDVTASPPSVHRGEPVTIAIGNDGDVSVDTGGWPLTLHRWDARRWLSAAGQPLYNNHPAISAQPITVRPGERADIATVGTGDLEPGWYSVHAKLQLGGDGGVAEIERPFEVLPAR